MSAHVALIPVLGLPAIACGDDLCGLILHHLAQAKDALQDGDIVVLAQKIVSKAEGRARRLADAEVTPAIEDLAERVCKDPRLVALVMAESQRLVRAARNVLIVQHRLGPTMANAGIDQSNVADGAHQVALLLPQDPDASAAALRLAFQARAGVTVAVVINDSFGRPWRRGTVGTAIGAAGLPALLDLRGRPDLFGRTLQVSDVAIADEIAAAASLVMGQADEGRPVVIVRGARFAGPEAPARALIRPDIEDLFR